MTPAENIEYKKVVWISHVSDSWPDPTFWPFCLLFPVFDLNSIFRVKKTHKQIPVWNECKQECETVLYCRLGLFSQDEKDSQNYQLNNVFNIAPIIY